MSRIAAGSAFLISGPQFNPAPHLWFVLTDPEPGDSRVVAVMLVTSRVYTDKTVVLMPGDHPFVRHESNVDFGGAVLIHPGKFLQAVAQGKCHPQPDIDSNLLQRLRAGLLASSRTVHWLAAHCRERF